MADVEVFCDSSLKQRVFHHLESSDSCLGYILGGWTDNKLSLVSFLSCQYFLNESPKTNIPDWFKEEKQLSSLIPCGLSICGVYYLSERKISLEPKELQQLLSENSLVSNTLAILKVDEQKNLPNECQLCSLDGNTSKRPIEYKHNLGDEFMESRLTFRIKVKLPLLAVTKHENDLEGVERELHHVSEDIASSGACFLIKKTNILLKNDCASSESCESILQELAEEEDNSFITQGKQAKAKVVKKVSKNANKDIIDVEYLHLVTGKDAMKTSKPYTPIIQQVKDEKQCVSVSLPIDVMAVVTMDSPLSDLRDLFIDAIQRQIKGFLSVMKFFTKDFGPCVPAVFHFLLPGFGHMVTVLYPHCTLNNTTIDQTELESYRRSLHTRLNLPLNQPLLRPANAVSFDDKKEIYLRNVHEGLTKHSDDNVSLVQGVYSYHHYMQDNFDDNGWGCAYRSLQTICSWFRHQGYTDRQVPSHQEIQQTLVKIGDKPQSFVGSRKWIGSFEVNMCLDELLGVQCKILNVNSGAELANKGRELAMHFRTQGTPVMIGGGVLAHTILGVDFNDKTGDIRFLILDPHYTGVENLKVIQEKGWCGWKGANFWDQRAHYNMCLPLRPDMI